MMKVLWHWERRPWYVMDVRSFVM